MKRTANALSVPYGGMVTSMLQLSCAFLPTTFVASPGGGLIEPLVENLLNVGSSGINKSGLTKNHDYLVTQTNKAIAAVVVDAESLLQSGVYVNRKDIPHLDATATQAASIQKQCQNRNLVRIDDCCRDFSFIFSFRVLFHFLKNLIFAFFLRSLYLSMYIYLFLIELLLIFPRRGGCGVGDG